MQFAVDRFGGLDILVTAAAFVEFAPVEDFDYEKHWKRTLQGELDLVFLPCKAAWKHMRPAAAARSSTSPPPTPMCRCPAARWRTAPPRAACSP